MMDIRVEVLNIIYETFVHLVAYWKEQRSKEVVLVFPSV